MHETQWSFMSAHYSAVERALTSSWACVLQVYLINILSVTLGIVTRRKQRVAGPMKSFGVRFNLRE